MTALLGKYRHKKSGKIETLLGTSKTVRLGHGVWEVFDVATYQDAEGNLYEDGLESFLERFELYPTKVAELRTGDVVHQNDGYEYLVTGEKDADGDTVVRHLRTGGTYYINDRVPWTFVRHASEPEPELSRPRMRVAALRKGDIVTRKGWQGEWTVVTGERDGDGDLEVVGVDDGVSTVGYLDDSTAYPWTFVRHADADAVSAGFADYQATAGRTAGEGTGALRLSISALGLTGEAGEFADLVKKHVGHGHPLDLDKAKKELGDVLWYLADACTQLGLKLEDVAEANIAKLKRRYPTSFSTAASLARADVEKERT